MTLSVQNSSQSLYLRQFPPICSRREFGETDIGQYAKNRVRKIPATGVTKIDGLSRRTTDLDLDRGPFFPALVRAPAECVDDVGESIVQFTC